MMGGRGGGAEGALRRTGREEAACDPHLAGSTQAAVGVGGNQSEALEGGLRGGAKYSHMFFPCILMKRFCIKVSYSK